MFKFIAENAYIVPVMAIMFIALYMLGGEDIVFFRKKHYVNDPKANEKMEKRLNRYVRGKDYKVMGPTTLEFNGTTVSFDALLLTYYGVIGFAVAPIGGDIYGELTDENWVSIYYNVRREFKSPVVSMNGSVKLVKDIFRAEKVKGGQMETMVVFTNEDANVAVANTLPAFHIKKLDEKLSAARFLADNKADIDGMKAALEKYKK